MINLQHVRTAKKLETIQTANSLKNRQTANKITQQIPNNAYHGKKNTRRGDTQKYILTGSNEGHWKFSSHNYLCKHNKIHKQLYPKSKNDESLRHYKSNKRIEDTTKGNLDQLDNQAPKNNLQSQSNETEDAKNKRNKNSRYPCHHYKTKQSPTKKLDNTESSLLTHKGKEFNRHKPQILLIETENKFEVMEKEPRNPHKTEILNSLKSLKLLKSPNPAEWKTKL